MADEFGFRVLDAHRTVKGIQDELRRQIGGEEGRRAAASVVPGRSPPPGPHE